MADITYIRLEEEFVYLAVIRDAYSRRVIGWNLDRPLEDSLTLTALRMALQQRQAQPGLVHHFDRGVQYASGDYTKLLRDQEIRISMSRQGNPYDNAPCESCMKTLKYEEVCRTEYRDLVDARSRLREFLEEIYNAKRLHSALEYVSSVEFKRRFPLVRYWGGGSSMSFLRHGEIFRSEGISPLLPCRGRSLGTRLSEAGMRNLRSRRAGADRR